MHGLEVTKMEQLSQKPFLECWSNFVTSKQCIYMEIHMNVFFSKWIFNKKSAKKLEKYRTFNSQLGIKILKGHFKNNITPNF